MTKIIREDHNLLHKVCEPVSVRQGNKIAKILIDKIKANKPICVGLASNQIGYDRSVAVVDADDSKTPIILINPKIVEKSNPLKPFKEGCMSFPDVEKSIVRYGYIKVETDLGLMEFGCKDRPDKKKYFTAIAVQHEIDHLNGLTIHDRALKPRTVNKIGRNDNCLCGSLKKAKKCCRVYDF